MVVGYDEFSIGINGSGIAVESFRANHEVRASNQRFLDNSNTWGHEGPDSIRFSLKGILNKSWTGLLAQTGDQNFTFKTIESGSVLNIPLLINREYTGCYLAEFELEAKTNGLIEVSADIVRFGNSAPTTSTGAHFDVSSITTNDVAHSSFSTFSIDDVNINNFYEFSYRYNMERLPRFLLGSTSPETVRLGKVENSARLKFFEDANRLNFTESYAGRFLILSGNINSANETLFPVYCSGHNASTAQNVESESSFEANIASVIR